MVIAGPGLTQGSMAPEQDETMMKFVLKTRI